MFALNLPMKWGVRQIHLHIEDTDFGLETNEFCGNVGREYLITEIPLVLLGIPWPALGGPLRNHFWKKKRPQPCWGGDSSGNALEASNAFNYRVWVIPAVLLTGIPGNALRAFPGSFRNSSGISSGKSQPYWGCGPYAWFKRDLWRVLRNNLRKYQ